MAAGRGPGDTGTAVRILDVAERLVQVRGFNGFSYADIAAELQITKAALHYHFASKAALGEALIARYAGRFMGALASLGTGDGRASAKLDGYAGLYLQVLRNRSMCLCGMLAAEYQTLPQPMQERGHQVLRPERELAGQRSGTGPGRRQPAVCRLRAGHRPHARGRPGRRDAHRPPLRRHRPIPGRDGQPAGHPDTRKRAGAAKPTPGDSPASLTARPSRRSSTGPHVGLRRWILRQDCWHPGSPRNEPLFSSGQVRLILAGKPAGHPGSPAR